MSIPSLGIVDVNLLSYDPSSNTFTWTDGQSGGAHTVKREQIVAIIPSPEQPRQLEEEGQHQLLSYIWLEDVSSADKQEQQYTLKRIEAAGPCPAGLDDLYLNRHASAPTPARHDHLHPQKPARSLSPNTTLSNLHIIISTTSGTHLGVPFYNTALKPLLLFLNLSEENNDYITHKTTSSHTITHLTETIFIPRARAGVSQTIVLLAGDGGVVDLVKALSATEEKAEENTKFVPPVLCLVPTGTGNATANSAGVIEDRDGSDGDATMGLRTLVSGVPKSLPTFRVKVSPGTRFVGEGGSPGELVRRSSNDSDDGVAEAEAVIHGAVVLSWGMHASLVADSDTPEYRRFGPDRFKIAAKELLQPDDGSGPHFYRGKVTVITKAMDDEADEGGNGDEKKGKKLLRTRVLERREHMYVLVTLCSKLERGFTISPASGPLDGQLRLVHFGPVGAQGFMEIMGLAYNGGKHVGVSEGEGGWQAVVGYEAVEKVRIDFEEEGEEGRWRRVCVDGTILVVEEGGWVEVEREDREVLRLVVPKGALE
ncbi:hypothetical protein AJ79_01133 [Helicocarpus griseus UAMH5409]|uniref:DAGKc domain-containing protein n=1 Tax=Helicocarpus griseus UAMH5409 TaxID=1447875 RepID=A0A2B7Y914_9EURO|nr:hypothetical protein AJ79_01133 [Helicocarpus griseus UAMH5409]